ncbi:hypothetical protein V1525DRAFT_344557, partial [Lipomyces kononenkoae]
QYMDDIRKVTFSKTEGELSEIINEMSSKYPVEIMSYVKEQWLYGEMKECWLEQYIRHNVNFGYSTTSPVEQSHHAMKAGMLSASATLHASALRLLEHEPGVKDIAKSSENFRIPLSIYRRTELTLITLVSVSALRIIEKEIKMMAEGYE